MIIVNVVYLILGSQQHHNGVIPVPHVLHAMPVHTVCDNVSYMDTWSDTNAMALLLIIASILN